MLYWISSEHMCASHTHTEQILVSFGLGFWLGGKKMPFLLYDGGALTESFAPAPASLTPNSCPVLLADSALQPHVGIPFTSHNGPINLNCCFNLSSKPFTFPRAMQRGNLLPVTILVLWKSKTNLPFLARVAALNLCY